MMIAAAPLPARLAQITIMSERCVPIGTSLIARYSIGEPSDHVLADDVHYRVDMAMTPRPPNARGQYSRHWRSDRYERLGKIWMMPPGEAIRFSSDAGVTLCLQCTLRPEAVAEWLGGSSHWGASTVEETLDLPGGRIRTFLGLLAEELQAPGFAADAMVELISGQIAIEISRFWRRMTEHGEPCGLNGWRLRAIDDRLSAAGPAPTLAELACLCDLPVRQLTRGFRLAHGKSIGAAIAMRQIEQAKDLLGSDTSLKVVAHRLGFASAAAFGAAFRKATGDTPRGYRMRIAPARVPNCRISIV